MNAFFEWTIETITNGDVVAIDYEPTYARAFARLKLGQRIVLVRDVFLSGTRSRSRYDVADQDLWFRDASGVINGRVPQTYRDEIRRVRPVVSVKDQTCQVSLSVGNSMLPAISSSIT